MARVANVKCLVCEKYFDRNREEYVKRGMRYIHKECEPALLAKEKKEREARGYKEREEGFRRELIDYTMELQGTERPHGLALKQMKELRERGYTYQGMKSTLYYFHEVLGNPVVGDGIGIVPFVYEDAIEWYTKKRDSERSYLELKKRGEEIVKRKEVKVSLSSRDNKPKGFDIETL